MEAAGGALGATDDGLGTGLGILPRKLAPLLEFGVTLGGPLATGRLELSVLDWLLPAPMAARSGPSVITIGKGGGGMVGAGKS